MTQLELCISALPKLPNRLLGAHWTIRAGHAKKWKRLVGDAVLVHRKGSQIFRKAKITLIRCSPRSCDFDGLVGSFKPILDALVAHDVIEDDTPAHIDVSYAWQKTPRAEQCVKIVVESA